MDGDGDELLAKGLLALLDGEDTQRAVGTVDTGHLLQNDTLGGLEAEIENGSLVDIQTVTKLNIDGVGILLTDGQGQRLVEREGDGAVLDVTADAGP